MVPLDDENNVGKDDREGGGGCIARVQNSLSTDCSGAALRADAEWCVVLAQLDRTVPMLVVSVAAARI